MNKRRLAWLVWLLTAMIGFTATQPASASGIGEIGHFHYTNQTYQYLIFGGDLYHSYDLKGAYTNNQDTGTPFQGSAAHVEIQYSGGSALGLQIDSPVASTAFPPGGYDYLTTEALPGAGANGQWVDSVLQDHIATIAYQTATGQNYTLPGPWYALSDVSAAIHRLAAVRPTSVRGPNQRTACHQIRLSPAVMRTVATWI